MVDGTLRLDQHRLEDVARVIAHNTRCGLCGQFVAQSDREALLEAERFEWSTYEVDEFRLDQHQCTDTDPTLASYVSTSTR